MRDTQLLYTLLLLHAEGPMTSTSLSIETDQTLSAVKQRFKKSRALYGSDVFTIVGWDRHIGLPGKAWAIYGPGPGEDKPMPRTRRIDSYRRYNKRNRLKKIFADRRRKGVKKQAHPFDMLLLPAR